MSKNLKTILSEIGQQARNASGLLALASKDTKKYALEAIAAAIEKRTEQILSENTIDIEAAIKAELSSAMVDRLRLTPDRLNAIVQSVRNIANSDDPVGETSETWSQPNGLTISKVSVPIGVIGMIYESRPNVTIDAAALCLWSGNTSILRGGSEAVRSNHALIEAVHAGLSETPLPSHCVQLLPTQDRNAVGHMLSLIHI